jgi:purine-nucleoside phosphorylase
MNDKNMIINPGREKGEPELPAAGLLIINPSEADAGLRLAKERKGKPFFLFNSRLMLMEPATTALGPYFMAGPAVGAPMAVLALEKLIALGAKKIIVYGWCGAINNKLSIGDILLPTWAVSDEGTSGHYSTEEQPESHMHTRQLLSEELHNHALIVETGPVWTTDAPYRESVNRISQLDRQGILGVDMEYSALIAVAAYRQIELTAVFLVSDELWSGAWKPGFRNKEFKKKSTELLHLLTDFCGKLSSLP